MIDAEDGRPADILLVEDNPGDIRLTQEAFEEGKIATTLHVVKDGVEALDFLYRRNEHAEAPRPDILLLDLNLSRKNGDEVLAEIRGEPGFHPIPVIVLTSSEAHEDVLDSYDRCANAYLAKPVDPDEFIEMVRTFERFWLSIVRLSDSDE